MKRRDFLKLSLATGSAVLLPSIGYGATLDMSKINFSSSTYEDNNAQTIIIFTYGGASQLGGNITNIEEIERYSQNSYNDYFRGITKTVHGCWQEAGGAEMETMLANGDMTLYRSCYSQVREDAGNKAHGVCTSQNQRGTFDENGGGVIANIAQVISEKGMINEHTLMPFVTMEGESTFYVEGNAALAGYLKPVGINESFDNPYDRDARHWDYYTDAEREAEGWRDKDPALTNKMDTLAQSYNQPGKVKDAFARRGSLSDFINTVKDLEVPDLGEDAYPDHDFANKIKAAIKLLDKNPDTKIITLGTGGLGGWDDHNDARDYVSRTESLFRSLRSAMAHLKAISKEGNINIMVFGEFGRNVNLNAANGWDHGNLQNFYVLGGKDYFAHKGVVGETELGDTGAINRMYLKPKSGSYWFEPLSIAATLYKIYGIENPDILTNGNGAVNIV